MNTKHTPGPWKFALFEAAPNEAFVQWRAGFASVHGSRAGREANARLIAAAPELLEAALLVLQWYEAEDDHSKADFYRRIEMCRESEVALRAAIAKATGSEA